MRIGDVIRRLRSKTGLALGAVGTLITLLGTLLSALSCVTTALPKWIPIVISAVSVVILIPLIFVFLIRPGARLGPRYLDPALAEAMVREAVRPQLYPVCFRLSGTHACGTALTALATKHVNHGLSSLFNHLNAVILELRQEHKFTKQSVVTHLQHMEKLRHRFSALASGLCCKRILKLSNSRDIAAFLLDAEEAVSASGVVPLLALLRAAPAQVLWDREAAGWSTSVQIAIRDTIPNALEKLRARTGFRLAAQRVADTLRGLDDDWHANLREIWKDELCKPD